MKSRRNFDNFRVEFRTREDLRLQPWQSFENSLAREVSSGEETIAGYNEELCSSCSHPTYAHHKKKSSSFVVLWWCRLESWAQTSLMKVDAFWEVIVVKQIKSFAWKLLSIIHP